MLLGIALTIVGAVILGIGSNFLKEGKLQISSKSVGIVLAVLGVIVFFCGLYFLGAFKQ
jgi:hypothetical protein